MRIRTKLTLLLIFFCLGPLIVVGVFDLRATDALGRDVTGWTAEALRRRAATQLELTTARIADQAEARTKRVETIASMLAASVGSRSAGGAPEELVPGLTEPQNWRPDDPEAERASLARAEPLVQAFLDAEADLEPSVALVRRSGLVLSRPADAWGSVWRTPRDEAGWHALSSEPVRQIWFDHGEVPRLVVGYPTKTGDAVVRVGVRLDRLIPLFALPAELAVDAKAVLVFLPSSGGEDQAEAQPGTQSGSQAGSTKGIVIASADATGTYQRWQSDPGSGTDLLPLVEVGLRDRQGYVVADSESDPAEKVVAGPVLDLGDGASLAIILSVPRDILTADAARVTQVVRRRTGDQALRAVVTGLLVFLTAILAAYFAARTVTRRIKRLEHVTGRVAEGDLSARAHARGRDEVSRLARNFNEMLPRVEQGLRLRQSAELAGLLERRAMPSGEATVRGFDVSAEAKYCHEVGGDCIDHFTGPGSDIVVVADVAGTGVCAALVTHAVRAVLRAGVESGRDAIEVMNELNEVVLRESDRENLTRFIRLFYLEVSHKDHTIRWCSAGHEGALLYHPESDAFINLTSQTPPLGVAEDPGYHVETLEYPAPGSIFYIGTDGVRETRNASGEAFGLERIQGVIREQGSGPAAGVVTAMMERVEEHGGDTPARDDLAFVILRATGAG